MTLLDVVTAHDVGTIINPLGHQGQIEGGLIQGIGFGMIEEMRAEEGRVSTLSLGDYKLPNIKDIPPLKTVLVQEQRRSSAVPGEIDRREQHHTHHRGDRQCPVRCGGRAYLRSADHGRKGVPCVAGAAGSWRGDARGRQEEPMTHTIRMRVNGKDYTADVPSQRLLIDCLRYDLGLTGTKEGCSVGVCGACTVVMDGVLVSSCLTLAVLADGKEITTVEGLAQDGKLHPVQQAFIDFGGFQCGICTPGMVVAAKALLDQNQNPSDDDIKDWMMGNLCRCTGYYKIIESIRGAATRMQTERV